MADVKSETAPEIDILLVSPLVRTFAKEPAAELMRMFEPGHQWNLETKMAPD